MNPLYLIRAILKANDLARWSAERGLVQQGRIVKGFDEGRALHHLLDELFGPRVIKPFRLLVSPGGFTANLYGYSRTGHEQLRESATTHGLPDHLKVIHPDGIESKQMPFTWKQGQRLGFDLRVRPVRRLNSPLSNGNQSFRKGAELDAFLVEALRLHPRNNGGMSSGARSRELIYLEWLETRLREAAKIDRETTRLASFQRTSVSRDAAAPEGPDAIFHGALTITNPERFSELLSCGVGRHRSYGYGMILLRPPNQKFSHTNA